MCDTQTLAYTADGYIIRCTECSRMQMAFGPVAIIINKKQFYELKERAGIEMSYRSACIMDPDLKSVSMPINATTMLCLSANELLSLTDLLDQATALMEVYEMLDIEEQN